MRELLRAAIPAAFLAGTSFAQTVIPVTTLTDGAPGSLRAALASAASTQAVIDLRVAGTCVLDPGRGQLPAVPAGTLVQAGFAAGQRFTIDARGFGVPVVGLRLSGAGARIMAPITVLVAQGAGVLVTANAVQLADVEVRGATSWCFRAENVRDLVAGRLVTSQGPVGVFLYRCTNSWLGDALAGWPVQATACTGQALLLQQCTDVTIAHFRAEDNQGATPVSGVLVQESLRVTLGDPVRHSSSARNSGQGVMLDRCTDCRVLGTDIVACAMIGCRIDGGSGNVVSDTAIDSAGQIGVQVDVGAVRTTIGPRVNILRSAGGSGPGVALGNCTATRLEFVNCTLSSPGVHVGQGTSDTTIDGCHLYGCHRGLLGFRASRLWVQGSWIEGNTARGIELDQTLDAVIAGNRLEANYGPGCEVTNGSHRAVLGPGNIVERNGFVGLGLRGSDDCVIADNPSIRDNDGAGIELSRSHRAAIRNNVLVGNLGVGIWLMFDSSDVVVGPGNEVRGTIGTGIKLEICDRGLITGNRVVGNLGVGIAFVEQYSTANTGHVVRSTLIADNRSVGVLMRDGNPVRLEACTVTGNYRGLQAGGGPATRTMIDVDSSILWGNLLDDYDNVTMPAGLVTVQHSTVQRPAGTGTNDALDPRFVDPLRGDYRPAAGSPALNRANQTRYAGLGAQARDCQGGDRFVDCAMDRGAHEFQRIEVTPLAGVQGVSVTLQWPAGTGNVVSALLFSTTPPAGSGLPCSNFVPDTFTGSQFGFSVSLPGVFVPVPADGVVRGTVPLALVGSGPWQVWAAGFLLDARGGTLALRGATGVAAFTLP